MTSSDWLIVGAAALLAVGCGQPPSETPAAQPTAPMKPLGSPCLSPDHYDQTPLLTVAWLQNPDGVGNDVNSAIGIEIADVDLDGLDDIVVARGGIDANEMSSLEVHYGPFSLSEDRTSIAAHQRWYARPDNVHAGFLKATVADLDGDHCPDILVGAYDGTIYGKRGVLGTKHCKRPGDGVDGSAQGLDTIVDDPGAALANLAVEDLDGDGFADIAAARFKLAKDYSYVSPKIYWGNKGAYDVTKSWLPSGAALAGNVSVAVIHAGDGKARHPVGVLFGMFAQAPADRDQTGPASENQHIQDGTVVLGWGKYFQLQGGRSLSPSAPFTQTVTNPEPPNIGHYPLVTDIDELSSGKVFVSASGHTRCAGAPCRERATPRVYSWNGAVLEPGPTVANGDGGWEPTGVGLADPDAFEDIALNGPCEAKQQQPGRMWLLRGPGFAPTFLRLGPSPASTDELRVLSRSTAIGSLVVEGAGDGPQRFVVFGDTPVDGVGAPIKAIGRIGLVRAP